MTAVTIAEDIAADQADAARGATAQHLDRELYDLLNEVARARRAAEPGTDRHVSLTRALSGIRAANQELHCAAHELKRLGK